MFSVHILSKKEKGPLGIFALYIVEIIIMLTVPLFTQSLYYVFGGVSAVIQELIFCQSWPLLPSFFSLSILSIYCTGHCLVPFVVNSNTNMNCSCVPPNGIV